MYVPIRPTTIEIIGRQVSRPYIDATITTMDRFGAKVSGSVDTMLSVDPGSYQGTTFRIPSDFSSAAHGNGRGYSNRQ